MWSQSSDRVEVRFGSDGDTIQGEVRGTDPSSDLALVEIDPGKVPAGVKPLRLADSSDVQVGDIAIAIGNPFGLDRTATEGIVSGVGREIQAPNGFSIDSVIQTDAPDQPRELRRSAARRRGTRDRRELADRDRWRPGERRHRLRRPVQHRAPGGSRADARREGQARLPGDPDIAGV